MTQQPSSLSRVSSTISSDVKIDPQAAYNATYKGDVKEARLKAVTDPIVKNPLQFSDPTDRQAATLARIQRIMDKPEYKSADPKIQQRVREAYYDKYVAPAYKGTGYNPPDKALWTREVVKGGWSPKDYYHGTSAMQAANIFAGALDTSGEIFGGAIHAGVWLSQKESMALLGVDKFFDSRSKERTPEYQNIEDSVNAAYDKLRSKVDNISHDAMDSSNFWLQTHPSKNLVDRADAFTGEMLIQLPMWAGIGAAREAGGKALMEVTEGQNLTQWLKASKAGMFAARRIGDAFDAFAGSTLQGLSTKEKMQNMAYFAGFGAVGEAGLGAINIASRALIKKFTAETLFAGGKPLQQAVTDEASHELENGLLGGQKVPAGAKPEHITEQLLRLEKEDPIKARLIMAEKFSLNSLSQQNFGTTYGKLSKEQRTKIRALRKDTVTEAINELPVHLADIAKQHAAAQLEAQMKSNPVLAESVNLIQQKYGIKVSDATYESEAEQIKALTGIKSVQGAKAKAQKVAEVIDSKTAETTKKAMEVEPKQFAQIQQQSKSFLSKPTGRLKPPIKGEPASYYADMDSKDFLTELRENLGNKWFFENPEHLLTWAYQYKDVMPKPLAKRVEQELKDIDPTGNPLAWKNESDRMASHLKALANTGRLFSEGNVFRSSQFKYYSNPTKWQKQLYKESEAIEKKKLAAILKPYVKNYSDAARAAIKVAKVISGDD